MYDIESQLRESFIELNERLKKDYSRVLNMPKEDLRSFLEENIGSLKPMKAYSKERLKDLYDKGGLVGVDGSVNKRGGAYPHYIELYRGLAKSTIYRDRQVSLVDIYSPMDKPLLEEEEDLKERNKRLATIEVEAALESIDKLRPKVILMDGGLIRYNIYAEDIWQDLRLRCEDEDIVLIGLIKDIKTSIIGEYMDKGGDLKLYDRELLFGKLDYGQYLIIDDAVNKKEGYVSAFLRTALGPDIVGMDMLESQRGYLEDMADLIFSITPEDSRGVPIWLDIVDEEVKVSDALMKAMMENYLDRGLYERFFICERDKRSV